MTVIAKESPLSAELKSCLESRRPLEVKARLCLNCLEHNVLVPDKHNIVLRWALHLMRVKVTQRKHRDVSEETLMWNVLQKCLESAEKTKTSLSFDKLPGVLMDIVPHVDPDDRKAAATLGQLARQVSGCNDGSPNVRLQLCQGLLLHMKHGEIAGAVAGLLNKLPAGVLAVQDPASLADLVVSLAKGAQLCGEARLKLAGVAAGVLLKGGRSAAFFDALFKEDAVKVEEENSVLILALRKAKECGQLADVVLLLMLAAAQVGGDTKERCLVFCLWLLGHCQSEVVKEDMGLSALRTECDLGQVAGLLEAALPLDSLAQEVRQQVTIGSLLQTCLKDWLSQKLDKDRAELISVIYRHHPQLLEPFVGRLSVMYLQAESPDPAVFRTVVSVMLQLRQLPKLFARLLIHLRQLETAGLAGGWRREDMEEVGRAVGQVPRTQLLEAWKTLNYHLASDCAGDLGSRRSDTVASVAGPLLEAVLTWAQLADHNLPSSLRQRIVGLATETMEAVLVPVQQAVERTEAASELLARCTHALAEQSYLLLTYRDYGELESVISFQRRVASDVKLSGLGSLYNRLLVQRLNFAAGEEGIAAAEEQLLASLSVSAVQENLKLCCTFSRHLPTATLVTLAPAILQEHPGAVAESPRLAAAALVHLCTDVSAHCRTFRKAFKPIVESPDILLNEAAWNDLSSQSGKLAAKCLGRYEKTDGDGPDDDDKVSEEKAVEIAGSLNKLPLEDLPSVLKLVATLVTLVLLQESRSSSQPPLHVLQAACRCLETTEVFRFLDSSKLFCWLLNNCPEDHGLLSVLSVSLVRFSKTLQDMEATGLLSRLEDGVARLELRCVKSCGLLLESLCRPLGQDGLAKEKRDLAEGAAGRLAGCLNKLAKKQQQLEGEPLEWCMRAAQHTLVIFGKKDAGQLAKYGDGLIRCAVSAAVEQLDHEAACGLLTQVCGAPQLCADYLPENWRVSALQSCIDRKSPSMLGPLLSTASLAELRVMLDRLLSTTVAGEMPHDTALQCWHHVVTAKVSGDSDKLLQARTRAVEAALSHLFLAKSADVDDSRLLSDLIGAVVSCTPSVVSVGFECTSVSRLQLSGPPSAHSLAALLAFLTNRPRLALRIVPVIVDFVRRAIIEVSSLANMETAAPDSDKNKIEAARLMAGQLEKVVGLLTRRKDDWARPVTYLLADMMAVFERCRLEAAVKTSLLESARLLLGLCDKHSLDYLSAGLEPGPLEVFKKVLEHYKLHYKFTGKV